MLFNPSNKQSLSSTMHDNLGPLFFFYSQGALSLIFRQLIKKVEFNRS